MAHNIVSKTSVELLQLSLADLQGGLLLHSNQLFPLSIYHLQQSVEKLGKALNIWFGHITVDECKRIGHDLDLLASMCQRSVAREIILDGLRRLEEFDYKMIEEDPIAFVNKLPLLAWEVHELFLSLNGMIVAKSLYAFDHLSVDSEVEKMEEKLMEFNDDIEDVIGGTRNFEVLDRVTKNFSLYVMNHLMGLMPNPETARYPEFNPYKIYDASHPLVLNYPRIEVILRKACLASRNFFLAFRPDKRPEYRFSGYSMRRV